jgi:hypothetical protein
MCSGWKQQRRRVERIKKQQVCNDGQEFQDGGPCRPAVACSSSADRILWDQSGPPAGTDQVHQSFVFEASSAVRFRMQFLNADFSTPRFYPSVLLILLLTVGIFGVKIIAMQGPLLVP